MVLDLKVYGFPFECSAQIKSYGDLIKLIELDKKIFGDEKAKLHASIRVHIHDDLIKKIRENHNDTDLFPVGWKRSTANVNTRKNPNHCEVDLNNKRDLNGVIIFLYISYIKKLSSKKNFRITCRIGKISDYNTLGSFKDGLKLYIFKIKSNKKKYFSKKINVEQVILILELMIEKTDCFITQYGQDFIIKIGNYKGNNLCLKNELCLKGNFVNKILDHNFVLSVFNEVFDNESISDENFYILHLYFTKLFMKNVTVDKNSNNISNKIEYDSEEELFVCMKARGWENGPVQDDLSWMNEISDTEEVVSKTPIKRKIINTDSINSKNSNKENSNKKPKILTHNEITEGLQSGKNPFNSAAKLVTNSQIIDSSKRVNESRRREALSASKIDNRDIAVLEKNKNVKDVKKDNAISNGVEQLRDSGKLVKRIITFDEYRRSNITINNNVFDSNDGNKNKKEIKFSAIGLDKEETSYEKFLNKLAEKRGASYPSI